MRVTLVYNPSAGGAWTEDKMVEQLEGIGWDVDRCLAQAQLDDCLCHGAEAIVVAGGDGTVGRVAKRLAGTATPASVSIGTANNVARSLGLGVEPSSAVLALKRAADRRIDLGIVSSRRRRDYFIEGFGVGVFASVMGEKNDGKDRSLHRALGLLADELEEYEPHRFEVEVDGNDCSGNYVLAATMNTRSVGRRSRWRRRPGATMASSTWCSSSQMRRTR